MRKILFAALATAALALVVSPAVHATVSGSQGFSTPLLSEAAASPTGNINTSTMFQLGGFSTTGNSTGIFAGLPTQNFGTVDMTITSGTGLHFANAVFGSFSSSSITASSTGPGFLDLLIQGMFTPGSFEPGSPAANAEMRIALTQTPPMNGEISASGTVSVTPVTVVPELGTFFLFGTGLLAMVGLLSTSRSWLTCKN